MELESVVQSEVVSKSENQILFINTYMESRKIRHINIYAGHEKSCKSRE